MANRSRGWFNYDRYQSHRHSLAAKGISTTRKTQAIAGAGKGMFYPNTLDYATLSSKEFRIDGDTTIISWSERTRNGFRHIADLYKNGLLVDSAKVTYLNRTWERYEFETAISKLLDKTGYSPDDKKKVMDKFSGKSRAESDSMFKSVAMVASLGEVF